MRSGRLGCFLVGVVASLAAAAFRGRLYASFPSVGGAQQVQTSFFPALLLIPSLRRPRPGPDPDHDRLTATLAARSSPPRASRRSSRVPVPTVRRSPARTCSSLVQVHLELTPLSSPLSLFLRAVLRGVAGAGVLSMYDKLQELVFGKVYSGGSG